MTLLKKIGGFAEKNEIGGYIGGCIGGYIGGYTK